MRCEYQHGCVRGALQPIEENEYLLCGIHLEMLESELQDRQAERQMDRARDNGREYPKGYDGTGAW